MKHTKMFDTHHKALADIKETEGELQLAQSKIVTGATANDYLTYILALSKVEGGMKSVARAQNCINKATTQRYILKVADGEKLTEQFRMKKANNKLRDAGFCSQEDVDSKKYFYFTTPVKAKPVPTADGDLQKTVDEFAITKEQYLAFGEKLVFPVVQ